MSDNRKRNESKYIVNSAAIKHSVSDQRAAMTAHFKCDLIAELLPFMCIHVDFFSADTATIK